MENILNNRAVRTVLFAAIGGASGYFIASFIIDKMTPELEVVEYVEEEEEVIEEKVDPRDSSDDSLHRDIRPRMRLKERPSLRKVTTRDYSSISAKDKGDLAKIASKYTTEEVIDEPEDDEQPATIHRAHDKDGDTPQDPDKPYVISEQEYNERPETHAPYTKTILHYFEDDVVTDESDEPISHPERLLGDDALVSFGEGTADPDLVFVLNPLTGDMYQVIRMHTSYSAETGIAVPSKRRVPRKGRKADEEP